MGKDGRKGRSVREWDSGDWQPVRARARVRKREKETRERKRKTARKSHVRVQTRATSSGFCVTPQRDCG